MKNVILSMLCGICLTSQAQMIYNAPYSRGVYASMNERVVVVERDVCYDCRIVRGVQTVLDAAIILDDIRWRNRYYKRPPFRGHRHFRR